MMRINEHIDEDGSKLGETPSHEAESPGVGKGRVSFLNKPASDQQFNELKEIHEKDVSKLHT